MSLLSWRYEGTHSDRAAKDGGMQRVKAGDEVVDDEWGKGIISSLDGSNAMIEFTESGEQKAIHPRPCKAVFAITVRPQPQRAGPTGRCGSGHANNIFSMLGGSSAPPAAPAAKKGGRGSKPFAARG